MYNIKPRTYKIAKKLGVQIFPSDNSKYKLEIYDSNGQFITYSGDGNSKGDYPTYLDMEKAGLVPKGYANERRRLYHLRHRKEKGFDEPYTRSWLSKVLLW